MYSVISQESVSPVIIYSTLKQLMKERTSTAINQKQHQGRKPFPNSYTCLACADLEWNSPGVSSFTEIPLTQGFPSASG